MQVKNLLLLLLLLLFVGCNPKTNQDPANLDLIDDNITGTGVGFKFLEVKNAELKAKQLSNDILIYIPQHPSLILKLQMVQNCCR